MSAAGSGAIVGNVGGHAAEQSIAGIVLSERLAVTMYGAVHRAEWAGARNLRGLVVDAKLLAEPSFRAALVDAGAIAAAIALDHPNIVPTAAVEADGDAVVVVTRGVGRFVTVQDVIAAARASRAQGGKLALPVAAAIARSVVEALAAAHRAKVVHGGVHPRSVLIDEDGVVRLGDFVVGRALTTAVANGADAVLWRGLAGFLAPELVVGDPPRPAADVFAAGALLFTMLSGEVPPGTLHVTPAVERLVQRALDTDANRRYKHAGDLLENLLEAFEDDRWEIAERGEVIRAAGLAGTDANIDDATEDLLASLGSSVVQVTPMRPSMDIRAEAAAARHQHTPTNANKLEALLADLDDSRGELTQVDDIDKFKRDPISEVIKQDVRKREAIVQFKPRVPSLDDPDDDDHTPLPPPEHDDTDAAIARPNTRDEDAAMSALSGLDEPVRRVASAAEQAAEPAARPVMPVALDPLVDPLLGLDAPAPRLKSRAVGVIATLLVVGGAVGFYVIYQQQQEAKRAQDARVAEAQRKADELTQKLSSELPDPGAIRVRSTPGQAGVWLKLGRTPLDSLPLSSNMMHELRIEGVDGYQPVDTQVLASHWSAAGDGARKATVVVPLQPIAPAPKTGKLAATKLPAMPPKPPPASGFTPGRGPIHVESTPAGAEVWLFVGMSDAMELTGIQAGAGYELRVLKDGFRPAYVSVASDEWRDGGDPNVPINVAKKKPVLEKAVTLEPDPQGKAPAEKGS